MFQLTSAYSSMEYTKVNFNFQYLKYESDKGFFFQSSRILYGMSFSDITSYRNKQNINDLTKNFEEIRNSMIGKIEFGINKSNFNKFKNKDNESSIKVKSEIFDNSNNLDNTTKNNKIKLCENNNKISDYNKNDKTNNKNKILKKIYFQQIKRVFYALRIKKANLLTFAIFMKA